MISLIWAMDKNRVIGKDNKMPWYIPADFAYFRKVTQGHTVIMGRKTFESIGKPLPGRLNVVLSRDENFKPEGCTVCRSMEEALQYGGQEEVFIIGGAEIYKKFMPFADKLYITQIEEDFEGDTLFPEIDNTQWELISKVQGEKNEKNPFTYYFTIYNKKA